MVYEREQVVHISNTRNREVSGSFVVPTHPTNSSQHDIRMIPMDAHNTQQQLALQSRDVDHMMTLSNICNLQQPNGSFTVPTQTMNSSQHDIGMCPWWEICIQVKIAVKIEYEIQMRLRVPFSVAES
ncbi:hypothetical protein Tco_0899693 [Tanacetum coccineum]